LAHQHLRIDEVFGAAQRYNVDFILFKSSYFHTYWVPSGVGRGRRLATSYKSGHYLPAAVEAGQHG
jgi:hypothetical protein